MKFVVLGSGTTVPHPERAASAYWLQTDTGSLLLDAGADAAHRAAEENLDWAALDAVWISHFHLDHVGGLPAFLFGTKYAPHTQERRKPLTIFGPQGLKRLLESFDATNNYDFLKQPFPVAVREVEAGAIEFEILPDLHAKTFSTPHTSESLALRVTDLRGTSLVYSSDTGYTEELASFAGKTDLFVLECSFPSSKPVETHLELRDAMRLAHQAEPGLLMLTHLYPAWDAIDLVSEAKKHWPGTTIAARDGLHLEV